MRLTLPKPAKSLVLVSMADIAFNLLIFLVVTVTMGEPEDVEPPEFLYTQKTGYALTLNVELTSEGRLTFDGQRIWPAADGTAAARAALSEAATAWLARQGTSGEIVVRFAADRNTPYELVDGVLAALRGADLTKIVLVTKPTDPRAGPGVEGERR